MKFATNTSKLTNVCMSHAYLYSKLAQSTGKGCKQDSGSGGIDFHRDDDSSIAS